MKPLSEDAYLVYILAETGVRGQLKAGRIERGSDGMIDVYDARGARFDYLSGKRLRSWSVVNGQGKAVDGWQEIKPEDFPRMFPG